MTWESSRLDTHWSKRNLNSTFCTKNYERCAERGKIAQDKPAIARKRSATRALCDRVNLRKLERRQITASAY